MKSETISARRHYLQTLKNRLNVSTLTQLGALIGLSPTQIYNLGRADRHASPALIEKLRKLAPDLDPSPLAASPNDVEPPTLHDVIRGIGTSIITALQGIKEELHRDLQELFTTLEDGDCYFLFTMNEIPPELQPSQRILATTMIQRMKAGASFFYCVPTTDSPVTQVVDDLWLRRDVLSLDTPEGVLTRFKDRLPDEKLKQKIHCLRLKHCPFFVPRFKFVLFLSESLPNRCAASVFVPSGMDDQTTYFHLPLSEEMALEIGSYLIDSGFGQLRQWYEADSARATIYKKMISIFGESS